MGKLTTSETKVKEHHKPLYKDIVHGAGRFKTASQNSGRDSTSEQKDGEDQDTIIDSKATRKILQLAKDQQEEIESEENRFGKRVDDPFVKFQVRQQQDEDEDDFTEEYDEMKAFEGSDGEEYDGEFEGEEEYVNEEDAKLFQSYFKSEQSFPEGSFNLADKVMAKIEQLQAEAERKNEKPVDAVLLPPKVIQAYQTIGTLLTTWTHGRLPKLFKVIPTLKRWEDVLYVTNPDAWTPNVCFEATKLFVSNFGSKDATKFVHMVLLERFRASIEDSDDHKLNYHLYRSLKKITL
ncbi:GQ68_05064T0 [Komagataella phaffii GS115]|nr:GQ68_05064T0 [Komagataella phaffii GS115]